MPPPEQSGPGLNEVDLYYDDHFMAINPNLASYRSITIIPVNDAPVINVTGNSGTPTKVSYDRQLFLIDPINYQGNDIHVDGSIPLSVIVGLTPLSIISVTDIDSGPNDKLTFTITLTPIGNGVQGSLQYTTSKNTLISGQNSIKEIMSIGQAANFFNTLTLNIVNQGDFTLIINATDDYNNTIVGTCQPGPTFNINVRNCPRTSIATINIVASNNVPLIAGATVGAGAGALGLAALGALLGGKLLKPKETDNWTEWDDEKLGDVSLKNPFYEQQTSIKTSGIYAGN